MKLDLLHHDNAHPHAAAAMVEAPQQVCYEHLLHPLYSPDLVPCDYHIITPLKEVIYDHKCAYDEEVKKMVQTWTWEQPKSSFFPRNEEASGMLQEVYEPTWGVVKPWYNHIVFTCSHLSIWKDMLPSIFLFCHVLSYVLNIQIPYFYISEITHNTFM